MCTNVSEICAEGIFVTFPWWLENVKSRSNMVLFSNERHFEIWFPKKRTITFFWSKFSKLHKKDPILHVATAFSLKQGETRTSHGPIPHPLRSAGVGGCLLLQICITLHLAGELKMVSDFLLARASRSKIVTSSSAWRELGGTDFTYILNLRLYHYCLCFHINFIWKMCTSTML